MEQAAPVTSNHDALIAALQWYVDHGIDSAVADDPYDHFAAHQTELADKQALAAQSAPLMPDMGVGIAKEKFASNTANNAAGPQAVVATADLLKQATDAANKAQDLDELRQAIADFDGIESKQTASQMVFADGHHNADIMVIGEKPSADDERSAKACSGIEGRLLDQAMRYLGRSRDDDGAEHGVYITNLLNWRPPGNRSPTATEIALSLPFLERHIALAQPKIILVCGTIPAKALLNTNDSMSKLRKQDHLYQTISANLTEKVDKTPLITSYPLANLVATPLKKKGFWMDLLKMNKFYVKLRAIKND